MLVALLVPLVVLGAVQPRDLDCVNAELVALQTLEQLVFGGHAADLAAAVEGGTTSAAVRCSQVRLARTALVGWIEARRLAAKGGAVGLLASTTAALRELEGWDSSTLAVEADYARTVIHAAIAAAQDERPEMDLRITHARDLAERLAARGKRTTWPLPFNLAAGELWFEVDRYDEARRAFERAVAADPSPLALAGLARAQARLGLRDDACRTYARLRTGAAALMAEAREYLAACP